MRTLFSLGCIEVGMVEWTGEMHCFQILHIKMRFCAVLKVRRQYSLQMARKCFFFLSSSLYLISVLMISNSSLFSLLSHLLRFLLFLLFPWGSFSFFLFFFFAFFRSLLGDNRGGPNATTAFSDLQYMREKSFPHVDPANVNYGSFDEFFASASPKSVKSEYEGEIGDT